ncbi:MAG: 3',5'-cyclic adenosine monophosphate phosphodiesterase CpdA [Candidatus Celerinatantimonas neptuna]|nr:MAG: 3',5'-cyclic adenosine monophosphate phosphodiesterase CpdA [Candidatus Celerinatantimonas neptuna]
MAFEKIFTGADKNGNLRLLQLTDTHLFANRGTGLLGINTLDSFRAVLSQVSADQIGFDWVMATGDISQDHSERSYERFMEEICILNRPVLWLPGNHDMQPVMNTSLHAGGFSSAKHLISDYWQLILLDTQVPQYPHGYLCREQLDFLADALSCYPEKYTLILMHHQSCPIGCRWLDQHNLKNTEDFHKIIAGRHHVKAVLFGHIHQNFEYQQNGVAYIASPSTCIQFLPLSNDFALDYQQPGYRYLTLAADGKIVTRVKRLTGNQFLPDNQSQGY